MASIASVILQIQVMAQWRLSQTIQFQSRPTQREKMAVFVFQAITAKVLSMAATLWMTAHPASTARTSVWVILKDSAEKDTCASAEPRVRSELSMVSISKSTFVRQALSALKVHPSPSHVQPVLTLNQEAQLSHQTASHVLQVLFATSQAFRHGLLP